MRIVLFVLVLACAAASPAAAARLALVIGIDNYETIPPLEKAVGDAEAMSAKLAGLGFGVTTVIDPDRRQFNQAISDFRNSLHPGDVAFVHFSGHGVEVDGRNLLLPRDVPIPATGEADYLAEEAIDLASLMDRVAASGAAVRIFVIDACRNNPFAQRGIRGLGNAGGLGPSFPARGSFVLYSAGYSQVALDRLGPDDRSPTSVYTRVLLDRLGTPGAPISKIARDVRTEVAALASTIGYDQFPAYYDELTQDFVLEPAAGATVGAGDSVEAAAFDRARNLGTRAALEAFLSNYPDGVFADLAHAALQAMPAEVPAARPTARRGDTLEAFSLRQRLQQLWDEAHEFERSGDDARFFERMQEARLLAAGYFGSDSEEYAQASNEMVGAFTVMGQLGQAMAASRETIRIYTKLYGENDVRVLNEKGNLAGRLATTGSTGEAAALFAELVTAYEAGGVDAQEREPYSHLLEAYAQFTMRSGDGPAATRYAAKAVALLEEAGLARGIDYAWVLATYARILSGTGKCAEALGVFTRAAAVMQAAGVAESQRNHAEILERLRQGCPS